MSELEKCISQWRETLKAAFGHSDEIVDELESHLREEINRLILTGHAPEAAFLTAQAKLGQPLDLAAEYSRAEPAAIWLPLIISLPLFLLLIGLNVWTKAARPDAHHDFVERLLLATTDAGHFVIFYTGLLAIGYVLCWLIRPISPGQLRTLRRTLMVANALAAIFLLIGMIGPRFYMHFELGLHPVIFGIWLVRLFPALWCSVLTVLLWAVPRKFHLWVLLSVSTVSINFWAILIPEFRFGFSFPAGQLCMMALFTAIPLSAVFLGLLPGGRLARRQRICE